MTKHIPKFAMIGLCVALVRCAAPQSPNGGHLAIVGGVPVPPQEFEEVVAILDKNGSIQCTATLITDRLIATAAHCIIGHEPYSENFRIHFGTGAANRKPMTGLYEVSGGGVLPNYGGNGDSQFDFAYLTLKDSITHVQPARVLSGFDEISTFEQLSTPVTLIGFGCQDGGFYCKGGTKQRIDTKFNTIEHRRADIGLDLKAGASNGDSGGPAFVILPDGSRRLFGITSGKGEIGAWYGILRTSLCWMTHDSKIEIPNADLHCYEPISNAIANKSREMLAAQKSTSTSRLRLDHAVAMDLREIPNPRELTSLALPDTVEANWSELTRFTQLAELDLHFERLDPSTVTMLITLPLTLGSTHPEMDIRWSIVKKNLAVFKRVLPQIRDVNAIKASQRSLLVEAAWMEEPEMVKLLLARGAHVDSQEGERRNTALHYAVMLRNLESARYLVAANASCIVKDSFGATVLDGVQTLPKTHPLRLLIQSHCTK